ncbi:MAG: GSCFA domain-containing protein [Chitinophagaceae bacterium]
MDFMIPIDIKKLPQPVRYGDRILLIGSCFTEHIGNTLADLKFSVLQNPHGILFDPVSVCKSLVSYTENRQYTADDLFRLNEVWHSWQHHSRFSHTEREPALQAINASQQQAHDFLQQADWIIVTLGSSFSYRLTSLADAGGSDREGAGVANCHRAPAQWFRKHLLGTDEIITALDECYHRLMRFNPGLNILFTVSPVRHIRDGVVENNRSKARLIEAVHHMANKFDRLHYFPAYELVIDVLRDYRFYDVDLVHPNYMATEFVLEKFAASCIDEASQQLMQEIKKIVIARRHKPFQPDTAAHRQFLSAHAAKTKALQEKYAFLDFAGELDYFNQAQ